MMELDSFELDTVNWLFLSHEQTLISIFQSFQDEAQHFELVLKKVISFLCQKLDSVKQICLCNPNAGIG